MNIHHYVRAMRPTIASTGYLLRFGIAVWAVVVLLGATSCSSSNSSQPDPGSTSTPAPMPPPTPAPMPPPTPAPMPPPTPAPMPPADCPRTSTEGTAYRLAFTITWTATSHPTHFPSGRGAHFTKPVGGVHSPDHTFWERGHAASPGMEQMAETGITTMLAAEIDAASKARAYVGSRGPALDGNRPTTLDFRVNQACPLVTFASMLAPSHDWFVAVSNFDLRGSDTGEFESKTFDLRVYDAGTENGEDFSGDGTDTNPRGVITRLTTAAADTDFSNGVHRTTGVFIGQFVFTKLDSTTLAAPEGDSASAPADTTHPLMLSEAMQAIADHGLGKVVNRIQQGRAGIRRFAIGNQSDLAAILSTQGQAIATDTISLKNILGGAAFALPLANNSLDGLSARTAFWGEGDYQRLAGSNDAVRWNGDLFSAYMGVDTQASHHLLVGLMISWNQGNFGYHAVDVHDRYALDLVSFQPYLSWKALGGRWDLWATTSHGQGKLAATHIDRTQHSEADIKMQTFGAGANGLIWQANSSAVRLKGEISQANMRATTTNGSQIPTSESKLRRIQVMLEGTHAYRSPTGGRFIPTLTLGVRHDAAHNQANTKIEMGGKLSYASATGGITLTGQGRTLLAYDNSHQQWSIGGTISLDPGIIGRGLLFSLEPSWGNTTEDASSSLMQNLPYNLTKRTTQTVTGTMNMQLEYSMQPNRKWQLTPYGILSFTGAAAAVYRLGSRVKISERSLLQLEGKWQQQPTTTIRADHSVVLKVLFEL